MSGEVKESTKAYTVRKFAALEVSAEVMDEYILSLEKWKDVMGETPSRLEVDFGCSVDVGSYTRPLQVQSTRIDS